MRESKKGAGSHLAYHRFDRKRPSYLRPVVAPIPMAEPVRFETPSHPEVSANDLLLNRELTWLNFNWRVASLARDERTPLLERVKFAAIVARNLDEFQMKRVAKLLRQAEKSPRRRSRDGRSPGHVLAQCRVEIESLSREVASLYTTLRSELAEQRIRIADLSELDRADRERLRDLFCETIYPFLTPHALTGEQPFPNLPNLSLNVLLALRNGPRVSTALIDIPVGHECPRFVAVPGSKKSVFVPIEQLVAEHYDVFFPEQKLQSVDHFRVIRSARLSSPWSYRADDLEHASDTRFELERHARVVQLEVSSGMSTSRREKLAKRLGVDSEGIRPVQGFLGFRDLFQLGQLNKAELLYQPYQGRPHPQLGADLFASLRKRSLLSFHPFHHFGDTVLRMLEAAAVDPDVRVIKLSLYRAADPSRVIQALERAAKNHKRVVVLCELNASFDEARNLGWAKRLMRVGARVCFGGDEKLHGKALLVVRREADGPRTYVHLGTGNYNELTANSYGDIGYFTCDPQVGFAVNRFFNSITTGVKPKSDPERLLCTPRHMRHQLLKRIEREAQAARAGRPARIRFKCNGLEDTKIIRALYAASNDGVNIELVVRDCCGLRPGVAKLSENIRVVSVLGRFLEHARVFHFYNSGQEEYWIGSADCMRRNLTKRVEILVNVVEPDLQRELDQLLNYQLSAEAVGGWEMRSDGSYVSGPSDLNGLDAQLGFEKWLSHRDQQRRADDSEWHDSTAGYQPL